MRYDRDSGKVIMSADELSFFAYRRESSELLYEKYGFIKTVYTSNEQAHTDYSMTEDERLAAAVHQIAAGYADLIETTHTNVSVVKETTCGGHIVSIEGFSDIISYDGILHTVEVIKTVRRISGSLNPFTYPEALALGAIIAYIYSCDIGAPEIKIKISFISKSNGERASFTKLFKKVFLMRIFDTLLCRAYPFIEAFADSKSYLLDEIEDMPFPYASIREGQERFIKEAYRTIKRGEALLVSAPTGIGKTISAIFPALKSIASGASDKIFYLTAKTITGRAALDAAQLISKYSPHLRACMVLSKEMMCPRGKKFYAMGGISDCYTCEMTNTISGGIVSPSVSYREREISALTALLKSDNRTFTPEIITKTAQEYSVCPYELSLDLSEHCQLVVCDCNYVIDDNVRFRRYFKRDVNTDKYVFLFDEAHNLPDRTRNTYSATITLKSMLQLLSDAENAENACGKMPVDSITAFISSLKKIHALCRNGEYIKSSENGEIYCGYYEDSHLPDDFAQSAVTLCKRLAAAMKDGENSDVFADKYSVLYKLILAIASFDDKFRFFASREGDELTVELLCIDPSGILERMFSAASSVIMFSATLSPMDYFCEVMGLKNAGVLDLPSPYDAENLCLIGFDSISTRYNDRRATEMKCAEAIAQTVYAREGNYIAYFPSYEYMKRVCRAFASIADDCGIVMQKPGMSYKERERFISIFREKKHSSIVGFCVLGGMFSEGIDLAGESLIGAVIVGCGMPGLSAERNIMAAYYNEKTERGQEFAYICPGMNKVMQAAGRVIRSETDRGVVVLIDDRLAAPEMKLLFPPHWRHIKYTSNLTALSAILEEFWEE